MPDIDGDDVPVDFNIVDDRHITWNTHTAIREFFGFPTDPELFGEWLEFFYSLNLFDKTQLRNTDLSTLDSSTYPQPRRSS